MDSTNCSTAEVEIRKGLGEGEPNGHVYQIFRPSEHRKAHEKIELGILERPGNGGTPITLIESINVGDDG